MPSAGNSLLEKRKLDALKRGIHRIGEKKATPPFSIHVVGIGKAGAEVIAQILRDSSDSGFPGEARFTALAVDIGDQYLKPLRELAAKSPVDRLQLETVALEVPAKDDFFATLRRYREFLKLEYPRYYWNPNYEAWVPSSIVLPRAGEHFSRAVAKGIYGRAYYDGDRPMEQALRRFGESVDATHTQAVVCIVSGLGGGTGSGVLVDLARHLTNVVFGRRIPVVGIGIAPCEGDASEHRGSRLFPVLNELDCLCDQENNQGVMTVWGDLYRNPFTAGFLIVPEQPAWQATKNLDATHKRVDEEVATFLTGNKGVNLLETLQLLNWVGAPPTQHSAARTQYGARWTHILGFVDVDGGIKGGQELRQQLGLRPSYKVDFLEMRTSDPADKKAQGVGQTLGNVFSPSAEPEIVGGGRKGSLQFVLPCAAKINLDLFFQARAAYDRKSWDERLLDHSMLLELGVMLCEPAIRFEGMAGECIWGCACWVVVPYKSIRGPQEGAEAAA
jgi:hypothetical protein